MLVNEIQEFPLSLEQQHLWFHNQIYPNTPIYTNGMALSFNGSLNEALFAKALGEIITRHEILRSVITQREDSLYTRISSPSAHIYNTIDYSGLGLEEISIHPHAVNIFRDEMNKVFELEKGPLIKFILLKYSGDRYVFIIAVHHIVFDGVSFKVFFEELMLFYNAYCKDLLSCPSSLPKVYPYRSFVEDAHKNAEETLAGEALEYWKKELAELSPLRLPSDLSQTAASPQIKTYKFLLSREIDSKIKNFSSAYSLTPFNVLFSAFCILLYRYSGQEDFTVGVPFQGRDREEIENTIGFFVKMLPIRIRFTHNKMKFLDLASYLMEKTLDAYSYQMVPLTRLITELNLERSANREALFQAGFTVQNTLPLSYNFQDLKCEYLHSEAGRLPLEINMEVYPHLDGYEVFLKYNSQLYTEDTMERMANNWQVLLKDIMDFPHKNISELELLTEKEKRKVLSDWNNTQAEFPQNQTVHSLFEEQAEKTPHNTAVVYKQNTFTYKELNEKANMLAHYLRYLAVIKPDTLIALCLERSEYMVLAILGALKAGGAYVPIDPSYPDERIKYILKDSNAHIILTTESYKERLENISFTATDNLTALEKPQDIKIVALDNPALQTQLALYPIVNPNVETTADHLIYVIYTSGTTGNPKGVLIEHRGVCNLLNWYTRRYHITEADKVLIITSYSFDLTQKNILGVLMRGGQVHLLEPGYDMLQINKTIHEQEITLLNCASAAFYPLLEELKSPHQFKSLRYVSVGGELMVLSRIKKIAEYNLPCQIVNGYGPTEGSDITTSYFLTKEDIEGNNTISIGKPIDNVSLFVLDPQMQLAPIGGIGELYIGGASVGRGYLNNAALTAEKFIPNLFQTLEEKMAGKNARLYKTGDLVRWLADGNLEYVKRNDSQVKIRGYRIELQEIEAALLSYEGIKQSVVLAKKELDNQGNFTGNGYLAGYYTSDTHLDEQDILKHLHSILPEYMVPALLMHLEKLPLTNNGKLDKKALPEPRFNPKAGYVAPQNELEETLCNIYQKLLGVNQVGIHDNFFHLGAHSLTIIKLIHQIKAALEVELNPVDIFKYNTVSKLCTYIKESKDNTETIPHIVNFTDFEAENSQHPSVIFFHGVGGSLVSYYKLINKLKEMLINEKKEISLFGLEASGINEGESLAVSGHHMISNYLRSIRKLSAKGGYILVGWSYGAELAFQVAQQLIEQGEEVKGLIVIDSPALMPESQAIKDLMEGDDVEDIYDNKLEPLILHYQKNFKIKLNVNDPLKIQFYKLLAHDLNNDIKVIDRLNKLAISNIMNAQNFIKKLCFVKEFIFIKSSLTHYEDSWGNWDKFVKGSRAIYTIPGDHYSIIGSDSLPEILSHYILVR